jgi:hypothetical protein
MLEKVTEGTTFYGRTLEVFPLFVICPVNLPSPPILPAELGCFLLFCDADYDPVTNILYDWPSCNGSNI